MATLIMFFRYFIYFIFNSDFSYLAHVLQVYK